MDTTLAGDGLTALRRIIEALQSGGHQFTQRGRHVQASCPLHGDTNPSLAIDQRGRRVVLYCHATSGACEEREVAEALGLRYDELWDEPLELCTVCGKRTMRAASGEWIHDYCAAKRAGKPIPVRVRRARSAPKPKSRGLGRVPARLTRPAEHQVQPWQTVDSYDHVDGDGSVVATSIRAERLVLRDGQQEPRKEKRFYQQFSDGRGGWGKKDVLPAGTVVPIWRQGEVQVSILAGCRVWLTEGHKDAAAIVARREEATTNIDGAGNLSAADAEQLRGGHVVVVCDRDAAGYQRGLTALDLLDGVADQVECVLPAVTDRHADVSDHFDAGHGFDDFLPVGPDELRRLVVLDKAASILADLQLVSAEIAAREGRAGAATGEAARAEHQAADQWAVWAGRKVALTLAPLAADLRSTPGVRHDELQQMAAAGREAAGIAVTALGRRDIIPDDDVAGVLGIGAAAEPDVGGGAGGDEEPPDNVIDFPEPADDNGRLRHEPEHLVPMSGSANFAYSLGSGVTPRGVYMSPPRGRWELVAELPHIHQRVIRRDGHGKPTSMNYAISVQPDDQPLQFDVAGLNDGSWANQLRVELSQDQKVIRAVATAIIYAGRTAPEAEATPDIDKASGKIVLPAAIDQYFDCAPGSVEEGLDGWRSIVAEVGASPKIAMLLGASAIAPFVRTLGSSHVFSLSGAPFQGKSVALRLAAGIWGDAVHGNGTLYSSWNSTAQALPRILGALRVMPVFRDETGLAGLRPEAWAQLAYRIAQGVDRARWDRVNDFTMDKPWWGIVFSTGNETFADGCDSGPYQGVPRRVIGLSTPLTANQAQSDRLYREKAPDGRKGLLEGCYGHLGAQIAEHVDATHAIDLLDLAAEKLTCPAEAIQVAPNVHMHLAGAMIIDEILGTGTALADTAAIACQDYLDSWLPPADEADRVLDLILDSLGRNPSGWPSVSEYDENLRPFAAETGPTETRVRLPQAGVDRDLIGVRDDNGAWVGLFSTAWADIIDPQLNKNLACKQLADRGILRVQPSRRIRKQWTSYVRLCNDPTRIGSKGANLYQLYLPTELLDGITTTSAGAPDQVAEHLQPTLSTAENADVAGFSESVAGRVAGDVAGPQHDLTRDVAGVAGFSGKTSRNVCARGSAEIGQPDPAIVLVHAEGLVPLDPDRPSGTYTDDGGHIRRRDWALQAEPCEACGVACTVVIEGRRIHPPCWNRQHPNEPAGTATSPAPAQLAPTPEQPSQAAPIASSPATTPSRAGRRLDRFVGPAAVLTADQAYLPGGQVRPWTADHLGELAMHVDERAGWRLGAGGDTDRLPAAGQLWLTDAAVAQLGLPTQIAWPETVAPSWEDTVPLFAGFDTHPMLTQAVDAGWIITSGKGHLQPWTRIKHPDLLPRGAQLVFLGWEPSPMPWLTDDQPEPGVLADRLARLCATLGSPYTINPALTGLTMIDRARPPRRDATSPAGANGRGRIAVALNEPAELPPFLRDRNDARFAALEIDWAWWRLWEPSKRSTHHALTDGERSCRYVHGYDRKGSYLSVWERLELGVEGLHHRTGEAAGWDGKETESWHLVSDWDWPYWGLPDPALGAPARVEDGRRWVSAHTLKQLRLNDITPTVHESYSWDCTVSYLEVPAQHLKAAVTSNDPMLKALAKDIYAKTGGMLAKRSGHGNPHLRRPDWWFSIVAASRTAIMATLIKNQTLGNGAAPLAVDHDAIFYASNDPDPVTAWPGDPKKIGDTRMGDWRPLGTAELGDWGPAHLIDQTPGSGHRGFRAWNYQSAKDALTPFQGSL